MKKISQKLFGLITLVLLLQNLTVFSAEFKTKREAKKPTVLVELFTSINCLNCPPAERALTFLNEQQPYPEAEIITLAFHVDYLNNENIKDEFSDLLFTQRQQIYGRKFLQGTIYTPQMIVDGNSQFMGSDLKKARAAVLENVKKLKGEISVERNEENLKIKVDKLPPHHNSTLYFAIVEDNLVPNLKRFGKTDTPHQYNSVVRQLKPLGKISPTENSLQIDYKSEEESLSKKDKISAVIFVQENATRSILAVRKVSRKQN